MTQDHPITPPPELFTEWLSEALLQHDAKSGTVAAMVADKAAQWGADQELEACCEWVEREIGQGREWNTHLRASRRPKLPSVKAQAPRTGGLTRMKYITSQSPEILELFDALHIPREGVTGIRLIVEPDQFVSLEVRRAVTFDEISEVTQWALKNGIEAQIQP